MKAVIFDCDGVLVDSETRLAAIELEMLADFGCKVTIEEFNARFVGLTEQDYRFEIEREIGALPSNWREPYRGRRERALREELQAVPGVKSVVESLAVPIAVASNSARTRVRDALELVDLLQYFNEKIVTSEDVPMGKPAPDVYIRAAEILGVAPTCCVAIEDSPIGVRAARRAGMTVFGYVNGLAAEAVLRAEGAKTFDSMADLPELLTRLA